uniref:3-hydroxyisobutyrate dehydrogenase, mitochondrial (Fragments) n=1 Tax=Mesocricetus auratus TaxID=10036 RepID=3HIDH_MESAU|nr:RecName: Full=3-hydroxyisobutyrate dehydrogenase, mitochondrial; Short=HIBADH [Mesocricetus auratus]
TPVGFIGLGNMGNPMAKADRIITMLPSSMNSIEVYSGANGILKEVEKMGAVFMDAPVSGGVGAARICNNMLLAISMIGTAEAMNLGIRDLGLAQDSATSTKTPILLGSVAHQIYRDFSSVFQYLREEETF